MFAACAENEYDCEDATCIAADLKCNQRDNCKFRWDEEGCEVCMCQRVSVLVQAIKFHGD